MSDHAASLFTLKMDAAWTSETFLFYHTTSYRHNPEYHDLNLRRLQNLKYLPWMSAVRNLVTEAIRSNYLEACSR